jgi:myo-inositol-1(or 4)-monophosphatase
MTDLPESLLAVARDIARDAGTLAAQMRAGVSVAATKSNELDIVTQADLAVESLIRGKLSQLRPGDGFVGEESGEATSNTGITWVVDPIDGTVNYLYGSTYWAVSIAVVRDTPEGQVTIAACVFAPALNEEYTAVQHGLARLNGAVITIGGEANLSAALVSTGFTYDRVRRVTQAQVQSTLAPLVRDLRCVGAASLEICAVAAGRTDAHYQQGLNVWDHAAGALIAESAGALVVGFDHARADKELVLVAGPSVIDELAGYLEPLRLSPSTSH